ncbi:MAG: hypothetical protein MHM6MM_001695 [Cercozoa sp. M6MM]
MFCGDVVNNTEKRMVRHVALRAQKNDPEFDEDTLSKVHNVLAKIKTYTQRIRDTQITDVVVVGIGGSYLGTEFLYETLRMHPECRQSAQGRRLHFVANVDPYSATKVMQTLDATSTLVIVVSKTFTTAETMLNARTLRRWLLQSLGEGYGKHMAAVSAAPEKVTQFGIDANEAMFEFWDWVGGRFSVTSAVGMLPLSLVFGFDIAREILAGARDMDRHFVETENPLENLPVLLALLAVWNTQCMGYTARATLPYAQALHRLVAHAQQVAMESNGKRVTRDGKVIEHTTGEIEFGEPGTNGQHSFYQLLHQGQVIPADFFGVAKSQCPLDYTQEGESVSNHDELMSNFFAQPDALAFGRTADEVDDAPELVPHKVFPGNRPSTSILMAELDARTAGKLLALLEHRTAAQGFLLGVNSFDQFGVELGKVLGKSVRNTLAVARAQDESADLASYNPSTQRLLTRYLELSQ